MSKKNNENISTLEFLEFIKNNESRTWQTKTQKVFQVRLNNSGIEISPSSGIPRPVALSELKNFCEKFNKLKSFKPKDYHPSFVKSYLPMIVKEMIYPSDTQETYFDTDEFLEERQFSEGTSKQVYVNAFERNPQARKACLELHGYQCKVCDFDFEKTYGEIGKDFIHAHHKVDLSTIGKEYKVDPINDLVPVCPNCHAMLHKQKPAYSIKKLKEILNDH